MAASTRSLLERAREYVSDAVDAYRHDDGVALLNEIDTEIAAAAADVIKVPRGPMMEMVAAIPGALFETLPAETKRVEIEAYLARGGEVNPRYGEEPTHCGTLIGAPLWLKAAIDAVWAGMEGTHSSFYRARGKEQFGIILAMIERALAVSRDQRQAECFAWVEAAFGPATVAQRGVRLAEEAIEAAQAAEVPRAMVHQLVDYIYDRPPGDLRQELGGIGVTVLALAAVAGISADDAEAAELARVRAKPLAYFAARNDVKNAAGFDADAAAED